MSDVQAKQQEVCKISMALTGAKEPDYVAWLRDRKERLLQEIEPSDPGFVKEIRKEDGVSRFEREDVI